MGDRQRTQAQRDRLRDHAHARPRQSPTASSRVPNSRSRRGSQVIRVTMARLDQSAPTAVAPISAISRAPATATPIAMFGRPVSARSRGSAK